MSEEFVQAVERAISALERERAQGRMMTGGRVSGGLVEIDECEQLAIVGDLHGDIGTLDKLLEKLDHEKFLKNPLNKLVFLGDYVDRGSDSIGVLATVCQLKHAHPDSVVLMRGNHEAPAEFPFRSHNLPCDIEAAFGKSAGRTAYRRVLALFRLLTLATLVRESLLLVHGGLPAVDVDASSYRQSLAGAQEDYLKNRVMEELLWSDPREIKGWEPSPRGAGRHFGRDVTDRWLAATGAKAVVRGHEPCDGFRVDHGGRVLTLFSSKEPYPGFGAAYVLASRHDLKKIKDAHDLAKHAIRL